MSNANEAARPRRRRMVEAVADYGWPAILIMALAVRYTGESPWTLRRAVREKKLKPAGRRGRSLTFERSELDRYLRGDPSLPPPSHPAPARPVRSGQATRDALEHLAAIKAP